MIREDLSIDQAMFVTSGVHTRRTYDGRVAKIARKYVTIEIWRSPGNTTEIVFDIETQKERGNTSHYAAVFETVGQHVLAERKRAAEAGLQELGLMRRHSQESGLSLLEIEAVVATVRWMRENQKDTDLPAGS